MLEQLVKILARLDDQQRARLLAYIKELLHQGNFCPCAITFVFSMQIFLAMFL
jgi:Mlc titration factor MtfA (ptsG expression regulator)